jgi:hypothetical protein
VRPTKHSFLAGSTEEAVRSPQHRADSKLLPVRTECHATRRAKDLPMEPGRASISCAPRLILRLALFAIPDIWKLSGRATVDEKKSGKPIVNVHLTSATVSESRFTSSITSCSTGRPGTYPQVMFSSRTRPSAAGNCRASRLSGTSRCRIRYFHNAIGAGTEFLESAVHPSGILG